MSSLNRKITSNKSKHLLVENELKKLKKIDSSYFRGKNYFENDGTQSSLVFQTVLKYFKREKNTNHISEWKSKGISDEVFKAPKTIFLNHCLHMVTKQSKFIGNCLKQDKVTFNHGKVVKIYIVYEISTNLNISNYPTLKNYLFGAVTLTKNADIDKYKYSGFDRHGFFSFSGTGLGRNEIVFGVDMSSSTKIDNKKKYILIFGKGPTCLSLHYNGANSYFFVNGKEIVKFKAKDSEIVATSLCLRVDTR